MTKKRTWKVIAALLMALLMVVGMGMTAFAAADSKVSIQNAKTGSEYSVYQIMTSEKISGNEETPLYAYTVNDAFAGFFDGNPYKLSPNNEIIKVSVADGKTVETIVAGDKRWKNDNTTEAAALAAALSRYAIEHEIAPAAKITDKQEKSLATGYYVIAETKSAESDAKDDKGAAEVATKPILVNLTEENGAEITLKDDTTDLEKVIMESETPVKSNNVSIGDDVNYRITTKIPTYEANVDKSKLMFKLTDTFTNLTYNGDLSIEGFTEKDYTVTSEGQVLTIEFTQDAIYNNQGKPVVATYSAKLNENANVDSAIGNPNDVTLEYTNNTNEEESHKYLKDETKTYTYGFNVHKVDKAAPSENLADAEFELYDGDTKLVFKDDGNGNYTVTDAKEDTEGTTTTIVSKGGTNITEAGLATVKGLKEGTYTLKETKAPDDYTKLDENGVIVKIEAVKKDGAETGAATLTASGAGNATGETFAKGATVYDKNGRETGSVTSDGSTININVYVENAKGISLPETGRNSALYCMIGGVAVVIFGALYYGFAVRRKRAK